MEYLELEDVADFRRANGICEESGEVIQLWNFKVVAVRGREVLRLYICGEWNIEVKPTEYKELCTIRTLRAKLAHSHPLNDVETWIWCLPFVRLSQPDRWYLHDGKHFRRRAHPDVQLATVPTSIREGVGGHTCWTN